MIQVENLVKKYGKRVAVDNLSFTVEKGQIYGFLGPNGAGKSTTMNMMTGYIAASSGNITINGFDILKQPVKAKSCIGYLPEIPPLYVDMTVWEYLMFVAELKKVSKKERYEHVDKVIAKIQLDEVADRLIRNLSKGYKQRVGLAQALIGNPEVLILDEPMVGMDPKQIREMRDLIKELAGEHTIILSSHILSEISAVCDHIVIISHGKLVASGSPEELQERMQKRAELELTICGQREQIEEVLKNMDSIEEYTCSDTDSAENMQVLITEKDNSDIRKELSVKLAEAGLPILSMNRKETSLEDIFMELTEQDDAREDVQEESEEIEEIEKIEESEKSEEIEKGEEATDDGSDL